MRIAIIGDPARKNQDAPLIEKASAVFEEAVYAPINEIRIKTGGGNKIIHGKKIISNFECVLPIPSDNLDIFLAVVAALEDSEVYVPYNMKSLLLFQRRVVGLAKLREAGFHVQDLDYFLSEQSVDKVVEKINFPVEVVIGNRSATIEDKMHLKGMVRLRKEGETILLKAPIKVPIIECMVVGNEVVACFETIGEKITRSINVGSSLKALAINATKTLGSGYGFVSLYRDMVVSIALNSNFSAIERITGKAVSELLLEHMKDNAKMREKSVIESIVGVLKRR